MSSPSSPLLKAVAKSVFRPFQCRWYSPLKIPEGRNQRQELGSIKRLGDSLTTYRTTQRASQEKRQEMLKSLGDHVTIKNMEMQQTRHWKVGDIYAPHDLSSTEMQKWYKRQRPSVDPFDMLGINPLNLYKNFSVMAEYTSTMGRIKHSSETGLRNVNQRRISKAIRRAKGLGLIPMTYHHPEILAAKYHRF